MASISSAGLGSGLDVKSIVKQLVAIESKPLDAIHAKTTDLQSKLSAFGLVQSYMTNLQDAASQLAKASTWKQTKAVSADTASVGVSSSTTAAAGSYAVTVTQLAQAQSLASATFASNISGTGTGSLHIELGSWNTGKTAFTPKSGTSMVDVAIPAGTNTLDGVAAAINAANAGVSASVVNDATGARLAIRSGGTGLDNALRITATADAGTPSLNDLVYNPPAGAGTMSETLPAQNALATVNGLAINAPSNTVSSAINGLTLTLSKVTTTPTQVTVSTDTAAMRTALDAFVSSYNDINKYVREQTKYDPDTKVAGTLQGDRSALAVLSQLRQSVTGSGTASSQFRSLSDLGVQIQRDGSLKVDATKFSSATSATNLSQLATAMSQDADGTGNDGFAVKLSALVTQMTNTGGIVSTHADGISASVKRSKDNATKEQARIDAVEAKLNKQYSNLDTKMSSINALATYMTQQITNWNKG